jgi:hypothetical protein
MMLVGAVATHAIAGHSPRIAATSPPQSATAPNFTNLAVKF